MGGMNSRIHQEFEPAILGCAGSTCNNMRRCAQWNASALLLFCSFALLLVFVRFAFGLQMAKKDLPRGCGQNPGLS